MAAHIIIPGLIALAAGLTPATPTGKAEPKPISRAAYDMDVARSFQAMDRNRDGKLSREELAPVAAKSAALVQARRQAALRRQFIKLDKDKNSYLSQDEFVAAAADVSEPDAFIKLDAGRDGSVSFAEFSKPAAERFKALDKNGDGTVSAAEQGGTSRGSASATESR